MWMCGCESFSVGGGQQLDDVHFVCSYFVYFYFVSHTPSAYFKGNCEEECRISE